MRRTGPGPSLHPITLGGRFSPLAAAIRMEKGFRCSELHHRRWNFFHKIQIISLLRCRCAWASAVSVHSLPRILALFFRPKKSSTTLLCFGVLVTPTRTLYDWQGIKIFVGIFPIPGSAPPMTIPPVLHYILPPKRLSWDQDKLCIIAEMVICLEQNLLTSDYRHRLSLIKLYDDHK